MATPEQHLFEWRCRLQELGLPADDLDDAAILREARLRGAAERLAGLRLYPGSWDKRFVRDLPTFPRPVTAKQEAQVLRMVHRYRRQLGQRFATSIIEP